MTFYRGTKIFLVLAVLTTTAVFFVFRSDKTPGRLAEGLDEKALPALEGQTGAIDKLALTGPEGATTLFLKDGAWVVAERADYPADESLVAALIDGLGQAEKFTPKTAEDKFFERLGLADRFVQITASAGGGDVASLKTGDQYFSPTGEGVMTFAFDQETGRAWALSGLPEISVEPGFWLRKDLLSLSEFRINTLKVSIGDNPVWTIAKETPFAPGFQLIGPDSALANAKAVNNAALAATELTFDDIIETRGLELFKVAEARFMTFDGLIVEMTFYNQEDVILTSLEAMYDEAILLAPDTPKVLPDAPPDGALEAADLNKRWQGRLFQIPLNQLAAILKFRKEFFRNQ